MLAKVKFEVTAGLYADFLNYLYNADVPVYDIRPTDLGFTAMCDGADYRAIAKAAGKYQCRTRITGKSGVWFYIKNYRNRKGLAAAAFLFAAFVFVSSKLVWRVNINTEDADLKKRINLRLYDRGICAGRFYSKDYFESASQYVTGKVEGLAYMTLNFYGGTLNCEVYPVKPAEKYLENVRRGDVAALMDGVITDIRVYSGFGTVKAGQSVSKGQVLISCTYTDDYGNFFYSETDGYASAMTEKNYSVFIPFKKEATVYTGRTCHSLRIYFAGFEKEILKADTDSWRDFSRTEIIKGRRVLGFRLPFTLKTCFFAERQGTFIEYDLAGAISRGKSRICRMIADDSSLIEETGRVYDYKTEEDGVTVSCLVSGNYIIT